MDGGVEPIVDPDLGAAPDVPEALHHHRPDTVDTLAQAPAGAEILFEEVNVVAFLDELEKILIQT